MRVIRIAAAVAAIAMLTLAAPAQARKQKTSCPNEPGTFDYYVLSLSWSPQHCATHSDHDQCETFKRFGFVLHGLWPQCKNGYPSHCAAPGKLEPYQVSSMLDIMPSADLVTHEWETHGTCSGLNPSEYFEAARLAFNSIKIPDQLRRPDNQVEQTPQAIALALVNANQRLDRRAIVVDCDHRYLQEVRICLDRDLAPQPCSGSVGSSCPAGTIIVRPVK